MSEQSFRLVPFPGPNLPDVSLTGTVSFSNRFLTVQYSLAGKIEDILLPAVASAPRRQDELWKATCFEFFLAVAGLPGYWEFNMSPSGDWNVYRMDAYRRVGFRQESAISRLTLEFKPEFDKYSLDVSVGLTPIVGPEQEVQMAITAILQTKNGGESYWALAHPAPFADFHLRDSFILRLEEQTHPSARSALDG